MLEQVCLQFWKAMQQGDLPAGDMLHLRLPGGRVISGVPEAQDEYFTLRQVIW